MTIQKMKKFNLIVCGGTFDHFHKGHKAFLRKAFSVGKKIIVGVTSDEYIKSSKFPSSVGRQVQNSKLIESCEIRKMAVLEFVKRERVLDRTEAAEIDDLFGPTLNKNLRMDAIVVSSETKKGAEIINKKRKELGLKELNIIIVPKILAEDRKILSSFRIRNGEINREGKLYVNPLWLKKDLLLPENLRQELQKPFGELLKSENDLFKNKNNFIITVGDVTANSFNKKSLNQSLSIIDFNVARKKKFDNIKELGFEEKEDIFYTDNPAGYITKTLFAKLIEIFKSNISEKIILQIKGEEDLAVLPLVLVAPLGAIIFYGQPQEGLVKVEVSEKNKKVTYKLVDQFKMLK